MRSKNTLKIDRTFPRLSQEIENIMSLLSATLLLILLIIISAIVSSAEIALAGARRIKLQNMVNEGNAKDNRGVSSPWCKSV